MSINRQPRGVPVGGQFAPTVRAGSALSLVDPLPDDYRVDESFPTPQANDLDKVACVVDAVQGGANTPDAIAESLDLHPREGAYYADAAGYLGLIEPVEGEEVRTFTCTGVGQSFALSSDTERSQILSSMMAFVPAMAIYDAEGDAGVEEFLSLEGLTGSTVTRRAATIRSWAQQSADHLALTGAVGSSRMLTAERVQDAAEHARSAAAERARLREKNVERVGSTCPECFMAMPLTGICDDCGYSAAA